MRTAILEFEEYPGEEIVVRLSPIPLDDFEQIGILVEAVLRRGHPRKIRDLYARWAPVALVSWTFPEPADAAGLGARDLHLGLGIITSWINAIRTVPLPLPVRSSDNGTSEDRSPRSSSTRSSTTRSSKTTAATR